MKILVIFTGGTIGSSKSGSVIDIDTETSFQLLDAYTAQSDARDVTFETKQPIYILSENLVPNDWHVLLDTLHAVDQNAYDGIIIAHGTDTLPYTAAALSFGLQQCDVPVMLVSSNYPLDDKRANGLSNFTNAVDFIAEDVAKGVFVVFESNEGESIVHLGSRLREADPYTDDFDSVSGVFFGKMKNGHFVYNDDKRNVSIDALKAYDFSKRNKVEFASDIMLIQPFAGLNYNYLKFDTKKPRAVLHGLYHSGTANSSDHQVHSIKRFAAYCTEQGVPIYAAPIKQTDDLYQSAKELMDAGVKPVVACSLESALVKLMMKSEVDMGQSIYYECL
ncbi:MAG: asparaginase [Mariprofundaceae bacterium]|nr:asparaginase [Mariprofundaceae bacterium]